MDQLIVSEGVIPKCPECGVTTWTVKQQVRRESSLKRVDGLGDLVVAEIDLLEAEQALVLVCKLCGNVYQPQAEINARIQRLPGPRRNEPQKVEAYSEVPEDGCWEPFNVADVVTNNSEWSEDIDR